MMRILLLLSFISLTLSLAGQDYLRIENRRTGKYLYLTDGNPALAEIRSDWLSPRWYKRSASNANSFLLENFRFKTHLRDADGKLTAEKAQPNWLSAQWSVEEVKGTKFVRIKNHKSGNYLLAKDGQVIMAKTQPDWYSGHWVLHPNTPTATARKFPKVGMYTGGEALQKITLLLNGKGIVLDEYDEYGVKRIRGPFNYLATDKPDVYRISGSNSTITVLSPEKVRYSIAKGTQTKTYLWREKNSRVQDIVRVIKLGDNVSQFSKGESGINDLSTKDISKINTYFTSQPITSGYSGNSSWNNPEMNANGILQFVVAESSTTLYLAIQGTELKLNALNNFCPWILTPFYGSSVPVCYALAADQYFNMLVERSSSSLGTKRLVITGHSQGAAVAGYLAFQLVKKKKLNPSLEHRLVTAMAPRYAMPVTNTLFNALRSNSAPKMTVDAIEVDGDPVPESMITLTGNSQVTSFGNRLIIPASEPGIDKAHTSRQSIYDYFKNAQ